VDREATKVLVNKTTNSFRTVHRKENASIRYEVGTEEIYKPSPSDFDFPSSLP
jgi:hypothetical protein